MPYTKKPVILSKNAEEVAKARYFNNGEDWEACVRRVAGSVASVEKDKAGWTEKFGEMIYSMSFIGGGRIMRNAGVRSNAGLINCYHLGVGDSIREIGELMKSSLLVWSNGGGVGTNLSPLRPKGAPILGKGGVSSGLVSFLIALDHISETIESGGQRRAAGLASVEVSHPEIFDFIDSKTVHGDISHFNISVMINDEFLEAVERNDDWDLKFNNKVYNTVKAKDLWDKIVYNMVHHAEPGLLNSSNLMKNNSWYYAPISGVNPCGEATLSESESCVLGSLVLPNFITGSVNTNWQKLERVIKTAVRFLDNVIDVNLYDLRRIDEKSHEGRRIGLGAMGLADYLFAKKIRYGSKEAIVETERLVRFMRDVSYQASIELAIEKGSFPKFDPIMYGKSSFVRKLPGSVRMDIKKHGIRNVTLMSFAPNGSSSLLPEVCGGIEPLMFRSYRRKDRVSERVYIHPKYKELLLSGEPIPDWFVDMSDLQPRDHFEMQAAVQRWCDGSCSKTINCPVGTTEDQVSKYLLEYIHDLKGTTIYLDETREGQVYNRLTEEEAFDIIANQTIGVEDGLQETDVDCNCVKQKDENGDEIEDSEVCEIPIKE